MPLGAARFGLLGGVADLGKLELIETQTITTSSSSIDFTTLNESTYNVHFVTFNNLQHTANDKELYLRFSDDGGSTYEITNYQYAEQHCDTDGAFGAFQSTSASQIFLAVNQGFNANESANGYFYIYNAGDSSKYTFVTMHNTQIKDLGTSYYRSVFGSGVYAVASTINAFRLIPKPTCNIDNAVVSLYGIAES